MHIVAVGGMNAAFFASLTEGGRMRSSAILRYEKPARRNAVAARQLLLAAVSFLTLSGVAAPDHISWRSGATANGDIVIERVEASDDPFYRGTCAVYGRVAMLHRDVTGTLKTGDRVRINMNCRGAEAEPIGNYWSIENLIDIPQLLDARTLMNVYLERLYPDTYAFLDFDGVESSQDPQPETAAVHIDITIDEVNASDDATYRGSCAVKGRVAVVHKDVAGSLEPGTPVSIDLSCLGEASAPSAALGPGKEIRIHDLQRAATIEVYLEPRGDRYVALSIGWVESIEEAVQAWAPAHVYLEVDNLAAPEGIVGVAVCRIEGRVTEIERDRTGALRKELPVSIEVPCYEREPDLRFTGSTLRSINELQHFVDAYLEPKGNHFAQPLLDRYLSKK
jgi:hypothetical protein